MARAPYLVRLTQRLEASLRRFPEEFRERHAGFLRSRQLPDGGFPGRDGPTDLYYSGFAVHGLACLGALDADTARRASEFIAPWLSRAENMIDIVSALRSALLLRDRGGPDLLAGKGTDSGGCLVPRVEALRKVDGGYGVNAGSPAGSTYHTFLALLGYEMLGRRVPDRDRVAAFLLSRQRDDGGFVEVAAARRGGTNPTVAAGASLALLGVNACDSVQQAADFLARMQGPEGGIRANARAPSADLLSTFTALVLLTETGRGGLVRADPIRRFTESLEQAGGGFCGGLWDTTADVEYTFYGLGTLALLGEGDGDR